MGGYKILVMMEIFLYKMGRTNNVLREGEMWRTEFKNSDIFE